MYLLEPRQRCAYLNGYGNGVHRQISAGLHIHHPNMCVSLVTSLFPSANAATFRDKDKVCWAVFNATGRNIENAEFRTCILGRK